MNKGRDKSKTLTSNISSEDVNRSKVTTVVVGAGAGTTNDRQSDSFKDKILSAVYLELSSKEARSKNVVVSGLPLVAGRTDVDLFSSLCTDHMHLKPSVVATRRLGKVQTNRPNYFAFF